MSTTTNPTPAVCGNCQHDPCDCFMTPLFQRQHEFEPYGIETDKCLVCENGEFYELHPPQARLLNPS